eukprot:TRINITY_DN1260_c1_g1_i1.p1 TRINITY_DN1260_c1_g1~~TRINITY_DN1260_c1_g1_i1.p1  ORF type:complete len:593 (+),score=164.26 TRINITY_DN1260_c1_g1_i1:1097-2875(+)
MEVTQDGETQLLHNGPDWNKQLQRLQATSRKKRRLDEKHTSSSILSKISSLESKEEEEEEAGSLQSSFARKTKGFDPRFEPGLDSFDDLQVSFSISLFPSGFVLGNQPKIVHPYNNNTKDLLSAIDEQRIPSDLLDYLNGTASFYEGCIVAEVCDYRNSMILPEIKRILLKPCTSVLVHDIKGIGKSASQSKGDVTPPHNGLGHGPRWGPEDDLAIEQRLLVETMPDLDLIPTPAILESETEDHYHHSLTVNPAKIFPSKKPISKSIDKPTTHRSPLGLMTFLEQLSIKDATDCYRQPFSMTVNQAIGKIVDPSSDPNNAMAVDKPQAASPMTIASTPSQSPMVQSLVNHRLRFHGNSGKTFCYLHVQVKKNGGGYDGLIRVGKCPDTGSNGEYFRFPLGTAVEANQFVNQLKSLYEKEGFGMLVSDSSNPNMNNFPVHSMAHGLPTAPNVPMGQTPAHFPATGLKETAPPGAAPADPKITNGIAAKPAVPSKMSRKHTLPPSTPTNGVTPAVGAFTTVLTGSPSAANLMGRSVTTKMTFPPGNKDVTNVNYRMSMGMTPTTIANATGTTGTTGKYTFPNNKKPDNNKPTGQ